MLLTCPIEKNRTALVSKLRVVLNSRGTTGQTDHSNSFVYDCVSVRWFYTVGYAEFRLHIYFGVRETLLP